MDLLIHKSLFALETALLLIHKFHLPSHTFLNSSLRLSFIHCLLDIFSQLTHLSLSPFDKFLLKMDPRICPKRLCEIVTGQSTNGCCCSVFSMKVDLNVITFVAVFFLNFLVKLRSPSNVLNWNFGQKK